MAVHRNPPPTPPRSKYSTGFFVPAAPGYTWHGDLQLVAWPGKLGAFPRFELQQNDTKINK